ncbi:hypothetical protein [Allonocardiopsis opalescens]|uniref:Uncharacterized protein n=1 Tax=Allonocardiopsis opalescens TaxID=1144618 RepID=A0A2T0QDS1_9ACTN|nr:hypothetical protein [Allonocardiopsis opalescens]PRY02020.1 hypothetical protein CLV72_101618 [Allonocardiopsis opalescens]
MATLISAHAQLTQPMWATSVCSLRYLVAATPFSAVVTADAGVDRRLAMGGGMPAVARDAQQVASRPFAPVAKRVRGVGEDPRPGTLRELGSAMQLTGIGTDAHEGPRDRRAPA